MPLVSVIMPTFDRGWIIRRAVDSVLAQTMPDFELIVVDDGSTDGTAATLGAIDDDRLAYHARPHRGSAAARNAGLAVASGDLVAYLDTDNVWHPDFLAVMVAELSPPYVMAYCSQQLFLLDGPRDALRVIGRKVRSVPYNPETLMRQNYIDTSSVLHRRSVLAEVGGFAEDLPRAADWDLFARIAIRHPFGIRHVDQVLGDYCYFLRGTESTITNRAMPDQHLMAIFGLVPTEANRRVRARIDARLGRGDAPAEDRPHHPAPTG